MTDRVPVAVLISGRGSNMAALIHAAKFAECAFEIVLVAADSEDAPGLALARAEGVRAIGLPHPTPKDKSQFFRDLDHVVREAGAEWIALAGFMRILPADFVGAWRSRIVNIHPSLLPKYKGLDTHARAIDAGDTVAGCSVHLVTEALDDGPVLGQTELPILPGDTPDTLAARILKAEHALYPRVLAELVNRPSRSD